MQIRVSALEISVRFNFQSDIEENITLIFLTRQDSCRRLKRIPNTILLNLRFITKKLEHMTLIFVDFY